MFQRANGEKLKVCSIKAARAEVGFTESVTTVADSVLLGGVSLSSPQNPAFSSLLG